MRIIEHCSCGGSIEVIYTEPNSSYSYGQAREAEEAKKQVSTFRKNHKNCRIMQAASE